MADDGWSTVGAIAKREQAADNPGGADSGHQHRIDFLRA